MPPQTLRDLLAKTWPYSLLSALAGFLGTIATVHFIGTEGFANYVINLAKLSAVLLIAELVPSSYSTFRQQKDAQFSDDIAALTLLLLLIVPISVLVLLSFGFFTELSLFGVAYSAGAVIQRYLDVRFQALGRMNEFYALPLVANCTRLIALLCLGSFVEDIASADLVWSATALGIIVSQALILIRKPSEITPFLHRGHGAALGRLWGRRAEYLDYYPNIILKRTRDMAMPLVCDWLVPSKVEAGKYLLAYRGVDFAIGQLRVIEALMTNVRTRETLMAGRTRSLLRLALLGQIAALIMSFVLVSQAGYDAQTAFLAIGGSFFIYPYTFELAARSDAYAAFNPRRVTISLLAFLLGMAIAVTVAWQFTALDAIHLIAAPLLGQTLATLSYGSPRKNSFPSS